MTSKRALELIDKSTLFCSSCDNDSCIDCAELNEFKEAIEIAKKAMTKLIALPPALSIAYDGEHDSILHRCMHCERVLLESFAYCPKCGRRINWAGD